MPKRRHHRILILGVAAERERAGAELRDDEGELVWCCSMSDARAVLGESSVALAAAIVDLEAPGDPLSLVSEVRRVHPDALLLATAARLESAQSMTLLELDVRFVARPLPFPELAAWIDARRPAENEAQSAGVLDMVATRYAKARGLSAQQSLILRLHLTGQAAKEIATRIGCTPATVYEHWRRIARKTGSRYRSGIIDDFHRFLDRCGTTLAGKPRKPSRPDRPPVGRANGGSMTSNATPISEDRGVLILTTPRRRRRAVP